MSLLIEVVFIKKISYLYKKINYHLFQKLKLLRNGGFNHLIIILTGSEHAVYVISNWV